MKKLLLIGVLLFIIMPVNAVIITKVPNSNYEIGIDNRSISFTWEFDLQGQVLEDVFVSFYVIKSTSGTIQRQTIFLYPSPNNPAGEFIGNKFVYSPMQHFQDFGHEDTDPANLIDNVEIAFRDSKGWYLRYRFSFSISTNGGWASTLNSNQLELRIYKYESAQDEGILGGGFSVDYQFNPLFIISAVAIFYLRRRKQ